MMFKGGKIMEEVNCPECGKHLGYKDTRSTSNSATTTTCSHCGAYIRYWVENGRVEVSILKPRKR